MRIFGATSRVFEGRVGEAPVGAESLSKLQSGGARSEGPVFPPAFFCSAGLRVY